MASEDVQTNLRLPADLKDRLVASAAENNRSLSAEVASRLESSYSAPIPSAVVSGLRLLAEALEIEKIKVLKERALAYRLANSLKFLMETGEMPTHTDKSSKVTPLLQLIEETVRNYKGSYEAAVEATETQRQRIEKMLSEISQPKP